MARSSGVADPPTCNKYGVPIYGSSWLPSKIIGSDPNPTPDEDPVEGSNGKKSPPSISAENYVVLAGGGGEGRSGIPYAVLLAHFDFASNSVPDQPVEKHATGTDLPCRMAVHPGVEGLICSLPKSCRWLEWDAIKGTDVHKLNLKSSEKVLKQLEDVDNN